MRLISRHGSKIAAAIEGCSGELMTVNHALGPSGDDAAVPVRTLIF